MYQIYLNSLTNEMLLRGYAPTSIATYSSYLKRFLVYSNKPVEELCVDDVRDYLLHIVGLNLSTSYVNTAYSSIRLFFLHVLKRPFSLDYIPRVKNAKKLPVILSYSKVMRIISVTSNLKHKAILLTTYSSGLRVSEVAALKVSDIDSDNMQIHIHSAKGNKDRYTILSNRNLSLLRSYFKANRPTDWLFPSATHPGLHLSSRTIQKVFKASATKAGILKPVTIHTLRHSFATHLLISGTDLFTIKNLMGHKSIQSTAIYLHLAPSKILSVKSPLDLMEVNDHE